MSTNTVVAIVFVALSLIASAGFALDVRREKPECPGGKPLRYLILSLLLCGASIAWLRSEMQDHPVEVVASRRP